MINMIKDFVIDENLKIVYYKGQLNVINYKEIILIDNKKIIISCFNNIIKINGNNLHIKRLLEQELLISGNIQSVSLEK